VNACWHRAGSEPLAGQAAVLFSVRVESAIVACPLEPDPPDPEPLVPDPVDPGPVEPVPVKLTAAEQPANMQSIRLASRTANRERSCAIDSPRNRFLIAPIVHGETEVRVCFDLGFYLLQLTHRHRSLRLFCLRAMSSSWPKRGAHPCHERNVTF